MTSHPARTTLFRRLRPAPGSAPDTLVAPERMVEPRLHFMRFGEGFDVEEGEVDAPAALALKPTADGRVLWLDVQGLGDGSIVRKLGAAFGVHRLAQSDIVHLGQRPKADGYPQPKSLVLIFRMLAVGEDDRIEFEQVSIVLGAGYVLTFQERHGDCLDPLRVRIRGKRANLMAGGSDYLAVQILDSVVDGYFPVLEYVGSRLEQLEDRILARPRPELLESVHRLRRELMAFRRAAWPLRDTLSRLLRDDDAMDADARLYLRDVADHVHQVVDVLETYREIASGLVEVYLSMMGHRTNEVMRVLTVISSIFIPLTFLAGIYGMNFDPDVAGNMPELKVPYAYAIFWAITVVAAGVLLAVFRRLGWLGGKPRGAGLAGSGRGRCADASAFYIIL
jgi:magnesium transporter